MILRFPHIAEQIFEKLDNKPLVDCRKVGRSWHKLIDDKNYPWLRIVNIPSIPQTSDTFLHVAARTGQAKIFDIILDENFQDLNLQNVCGSTPFHTAMENGQVETMRYFDKT